MTDLEQHMIEMIARATRHPIDRQTQLAALAYARHRGLDIAKVRRIILDKRLAWLNWLTCTQRRWQQETRRASKARHHDSIEIREKHVRC